MLFSEEFSNYSAAVMTLAYCDQHFNKLYMKHIAQHDWLIDFYSCVTPQWSSGHMDFEAITHVLWSTHFFVDYTSLS